MPPSSCDKVVVGPGVPVDTRDAPPGPVAGRDQSVHLSVAVGEVGVAGDRHHAVLLVAGAPVAAGYRVVVVNNCEVKLEKSPSEM